jgi:hypothetical protein
LQDIPCCNSVMKERTIATLATIAGCPRVDFRETEPAAQFLRVRVRDPERGNRPPPSGIARSERCWALGQVEVGLGERLGVFLHAGKPNPARESRAPQGGNARGARDTRFLDGEGPDRELFVRGFRALGRIFDAPARLWAQSTTSPFAARMWPVRRSLSRQWFILEAALLWGSAGWLSACSNDDECETDEQRCGDASTAQICQSYGGSGCGDDVLCGLFSKGPTLRWAMKRLCGGGTTCVMAGAEAVCSLTTKPSPLCAQGGYICMQNDLVECVSGYPALAFSCGDVDSCKQTAFADRSCAYCANNPTRNATCALGAASACANNSIYDCMCDDLYKLSATCGAVETCVTVQRPGTSGPGYLDTFCALSSQPDPRCPNTSGGYYCTGSVWTSCTNGYAVAAPSSFTCQ